MVSANLGEFPGKKTRAGGLGHWKAKAIIYEDEARGKQGVEVHAGIQRWSNSGESRSC